MVQILERCAGTLGIAHDVDIGYRRTEVEHNQNLHNFIFVAKKEGLMFNSEKCCMKENRIHFFGTIYDASGAHPDP